MRRAFLIWLSALICAAFVVTGAVTYYQFKNHAQDRAAQMLSSKLTDLMELVTHSAGNLEQVASINSASSLYRTRALAEMIRLNPRALKNQETLQGYCNELGAGQEDEACITNEKGVVVAAVPARLVGTDLSLDESSRPYMECISTPGKEVCPPPNLSNSGQNIMQYAGVSRRDSKGLVRMGFRSHHEQVMRAAANFGKLASHYDLGKNSHIIAFYGGEALNKDELPGVTDELLGIPLDEAREITLNDEDYYTYAIENNGFRLVGLMTRSQLRHQTLVSVRRLVMSNFVLFVLMFLMVAYLLQRLVIRGIRVINSSLQRITDGELGLRVEVHSCPEFAGLSSGINSMADTLLGYAEGERQRLQDELELARNIQFTALPNKFPAYPNHPEFDLYATCTQANEVGGDFYDFFKLDSSHLAFLVADVTGTGIPAALFMMRCMSVIRSVARVVSDPLDIVKEANHILCQGNKADMRLTMFFGSLDFRTGELRYVNAGPPFALLQHAGGGYAVMTRKSGSELGLSDNSTYEPCTLMLEPGDRLFLYTEGVINAMDAGKTPFGEARLQAALQEKAANVNEVLRNVRAALRQFIGNTEPNMDITMLSLEYQGALHAHGGICTPAGKQDEVGAALSAPLESVLAAPSCISDVEASVISILNALPEDLPVDIRLRCNSQEALVTLTYGKPDFNPLISLPHLPVDKVHYSSDAATGSTLTLWKNLE